MVETLDAYGIERTDYVVSGVPFSFLVDDEKRELLLRTCEVLAEEGASLVYQNHDHVGVPLRAHFSDVTKEYDPRNLPPTMFACWARPWAPIRFFFN